MENKLHYFYVLECSDGTYYAGYTNNITKRIQSHNDGKGAKYTRGRVPVKLMLTEPYRNKGDALKAEYRFKQLPRKKKEEYIKRSSSTSAFDKLSIEK